MVIPSVALGKGGLIPAYPGIFDLTFDSDLATGAASSSLAHDAGILKTLNNCG